VIGSKKLFPELEKKKKKKQSDRVANFSSRKGFNFKFCQIHEVIWC